MIEETQILSKKLTKTALNEREYFMFSVFASEKLSIIRSLVGYSWVGITKGQLLGWIAWGFFPVSRNLCYKLIIISLITGLELRNYWVAVLLNWPKSNDFFSFGYFKELTFISELQIKQEQGLKIRRCHCKYWRWVPVCKTKFHSVLSIKLYILWNLTSENEKQTINFFFVIQCYYPQSILDSIAVLLLLNGSNLYRAGCQDMLYFLYRINICQVTSVFLMHI